MCSSKVEAVLLPASVSYLSPSILNQSRNSYKNKANVPSNLILNIHPSPNMYNYYNYVTYFSKRDTFTQNNLIKCLHSCTWSPFHHFVHEVNELGILEELLL